MMSLPAPTAVRRDGARPRPALHAAILGTGSFAPDGVITNADLEALVATSDAWIVQRTGIRERRRAGPGITSALMAAEAGRRALGQAGVDRVDAIVVATCTPDNPIPSTACLVQARLGLVGIPAFDINAACSGFVYGLSIAQSLIASRAIGSMLLIGVDRVTSIVDFTDRTTCVLFGDAAGATVIGGVADGGVSALAWGADGRESDLIHYGPKPGEPGSKPGVRMAGKGTYRLAVERICEVTAQLCADAGWSIEDVDLVIPHQANLRIIEAAMQRLHIPMERVVVNVERYGNTSAASIPLALAEAHAAGRLRDGDRIVAAAFGSGVTWGGVALRWIAPTR